MARPLRLEYEDAIYHVTSRGNERQKIFFSTRDYAKFKEYLCESIQKFRYLLHGYVLMTNHYHLIIETPEANLSAIMHYLNGAYTTYINVKRRRCGHLFQGRFKSIIVDKDIYLLELSRYVHLNPVRANMVEKPEQYPHSSYASYVGTSTDSFVTTSSVLDMVSTKVHERRKRYREYVERVVAGGCESPFKAVYGGIILGSTDFIKDALSRIERQQLEKEETSCRRPLSASNLVTEVLSLACQQSGLTLEQMNDPGCKDVRKKVLYLLKEETSSSNREIGDLLGMRPAAVAKAYQRYVQLMEKDEQLRLEIQKFEKELSRVKG